MRQLSFLVFGLLSVLSIVWIGSCYLNLRKKEGVCVFRQFHTV